MTYKNTQKRCAATDSAPLNSSVGFYDDKIPENKRLDLCICGHKREQHYNGRGLCENQRWDGTTCSCRRFKKQNEHDQRPKGGAE